MADRAYVLVETVMGRSMEVAAELRKWDWVECVERVMGPYDIVALCEGSAVSDVAGLVSDGLSSVDGVVRIVVCPISTGFQTAVPAIPVLVH